MSILILKVLQFSPIKMKTETICNIYWNPKTVLLTTPRFLDIFLIDPPVKSCSYLLRVSDKLSSYNLQQFLKTVNFSTINFFFFIINSRTQILMKKRNNNNSGLSIGGSNKEYSLLNIRFDRYYCNIRIAEDK